MMEPMSMVEVRPGDTVVVVNAFGQRDQRRALSGVELEGHDFPVIWVCSNDEWQLATAEDREPEGVPWPADDVHR